MWAFLILLMLRVTQKGEREEEPCLPRDSGIRQNAPFLELQERLKITQSQITEHTAGLSPTLIYARSYCP